MEAPCSERCEMFSFLISTPFQLKRFSQPLEEETSRVFMLRNEVQDVQVLSGHVYRESAQTAPMHSGMAVTLE